MTHDPVCPCSGICDPPGEPCSMSGCGCECDGIALGRADEREQAAQRVESCVNKFKARDYNDAVDACAAAVRGKP